MQQVRFVALALLAALAACADSGPAEKGGLQRIAAPDAEASVQPTADEPLAPFFVRLDALGSGRTRLPVSVVQIGDSHSAADFFSARMRTLLQDRFGAAGRGLLPPGVPDRYYDPKLVAVSQSAEWRRASSRAGDPAPYGLGGVVQSTDTAGARMTLSAREAEGFDLVWVDYRRRGDGGAFALSSDGGPALTVSTQGADGTRRAAFAAARGSHQLDLTTQGDGTVELVGWGVARRGAGLLYQNFGVIGAQVDVLDRLDRASLATELAGVPLVIVAFGTNEAFGRADDLADYQARFTRQVAALQSASHGAVVVVGPPDVNRSPGSAGPDAELCTAEAAPASLFVGVATRAHHASGRSSGHGATRGTRAGGRHGRAYARRPSPPAWARPAQVDMVASAQRAAAAANGWYFWDWSAAMGGACAMRDWVASGLGRGDHVHMSADGYARSADLLYADLAARYDQWRARHGEPPGKTVSRPVAAAQ